MRRLPQLWTVFWLLALWTTQAHAGNYEGILIGSQAALTGGAVTATVADGAAAWYNPAGIARRQAVGRRAFGVGAFTDLHGLRAGATLDYVGVAGGVRLTKRYPLAEGGRTIVVVTTLAGRYAYGWGHANGVAFQGDSPSTYTLTTVPMTSHEMAFNLASGVSF